jgi:hypothetical protein
MSPLKLVQLENILVIFVTFDVFKVSRFDTKDTQPLNILVQFEGSVNSEIVGKDARFVQPANCWPLVERESPP